MKTREGPGDVAYNWAQALARIRKESPPQVNLSTLQNCRFADGTLELSDGISDLQPDELQLCLKAW